jgi:redox-sensitive bicupin YhaK (pirin superfamily)
MLIIEPHTKDLGGFSVRRLLPAAKARSIGPFVFFDHVGPAQFAPGEGVDVRPHPHIGLATVTYLFEGALVHRDSLGNVQRIEPGAVNWMTAGHGIVHSERSDNADRVAIDDRARRLHGIQVWVALPKTHERTDPAFFHVEPEQLPLIRSAGVEMRLVVGNAFGEHAPTPHFSEICYLAATMQPGATIEWPAEHDERGLYLVDGDLRVQSEPLSARKMLAWTGADAGGSITIEARTNSMLVLFGGARLDGERILDWNFVATSRALIDEARQRWRDRRFPEIPGETEWIPLPGG